MLHSYAINMADVFAFRAVDRVMPVVPMVHANGWGIPHAVAMVDSSLVLPGRDLDGASLEWLMNREPVTFSAGKSAGNFAPHGAVTSGQTARKRL